MQVQGKISLGTYVDILQMTTQ